MQTSCSASLNTETRMPTFEQIADQYSVYCCVINLQNAIILYELFNSYQHDTFNQLLQLITLWACQLFIEFILRAIYLVFFEIEIKAIIEWINHCCFIIICRVEITIFPCRRKNSSIMFVFFFHYFSIA